MKCALAVNHENNFSDQHFGTAESFMIYSWEDWFRNKNGNYMLSRIKYGVLKSQIRAAE